MSVEEGIRYVGPVIDGPNAGSRLIHYSPKHFVIYRQNDGTLWEITYVFTADEVQPRRSSTTQIVGKWACGISIVRKG